MMCCVDQTCAEETLGQAERALREKEEQLTRLRAEHEALRVELAAVKEGLSSSTERAEKLLQDGQMKDKALVDLETHNQRLKTELRGLQVDLALQEEEVAYQQRELALQEEEVAYQQRELEDLRGRYVLQDPAPGSALCKATPDDFSSLLSHERSLSSPELLRKRDCSEEPAALHVSRLSELSAPHNTSLDLHMKASPLDLHMKVSPLDRGGSQPPEILSTSCSLDSIVASANLSALESLEAEKVKDFEQLSLTPSPSPVWASDGYGSNMSSELGTRLNVELAMTERLDANFVEYLQNRGMDLADHTDSVADSEGPSLELLSPELQGLLKRVYQEGSRVLALSHRPAGDDPPSTWQTEKRALQQTVLSLRELLCKMADKRLKAEGGDADWRRELLQAVRSVFDSERLSMHSELHSLITAQGLPDPASLTGHLEQLLKQQEERQHRSLENLLSAEQHSLLAEVHNLQTQLRISSLQNQEQLQQLQGSLSATQDEDCQQQHQLRRQMELLEYRLQQEEVCANGLRSSLQAEQARGAVLRAEQGAVEQLKQELEESRLQLNNFSRAQQEVLRLRMRLESEQAERQVREEAVQLERLQIQQLQQELEQERLRSQSRLEQEEQALQELQSSLQDRSAQVTELRGALEQERVVSSNLRLELLIEQSRCEALIAQERNRTVDARRQLEDQCAQLTDTLIQEKQEYGRKLEEAQRLLQELQTQLEQVCRQREDLQTQLEQVCRQREELQTQLEQVCRQRVELQTQLEQVCRQREDLQTQLEHFQELAAQTKRRLEEEAQQEAAMQDAMREKERHRERPRRREQAERDHQQDRTSEKVGPPPVFSSGLVGRVLQENSDLSCQLAMLSEDKVTLKHTVSCLERELHAQKWTHATREQVKSPEPVNAALLSEKLAWQKERSVLQTALRKAESDLSRVSAEIENRSGSDHSSSKMHRLYGRYLRAESFRKALVYQKKYLLLLLGGFQDCEQATLSLIARMGVYPSPMDLQTATPRSHPINRFRTSVRVVIAVSRLRFLVRKWQKAIKKGPVIAAVVNGHGHSNGPNVRVEVLRQQHPGVINSPPTRDSSLSQRDMVAPIKSPLTLHNRLYPNPTLVPVEGALTLSHDPERSLTEYIQHLETIQQRLSGMRPGSPSGISYSRKSDR